MNARPLSNSELMKDVLLHGNHCHGCRYLVIYQLDAQKNRYVVSRCARHIKTLGIHIPDESKERTEEFLNPIDTPLPFKCRNFLCKNKENQGDPVVAPRLVVNIGNIEEFLDDPDSSLVVFRAQFDQVREAIQATTPSKVALEYIRKEIFTGYKVVLKEKNPHDT